MTDLCLQVHPERAPDLDLAALRAACEALAEIDLVERFAVVEGDDERAYVNFMFATQDVGALWAELSARLYGDARLGPALTRASMAMCEGASGWEDYRLLAHYDAGVAVSGIG